MYGGHRGINPRYASRDLLTRLSAGTAEEIDAFVQHRLATPLLAQPPLSAELASSGLTAAGQSGYVVIHAEGRTTGGARVAIEAVVDLGNIRKGIRLVDWRPVSSGTAAEAPDVE